MKACTSLHEPDEYPASGQQASDIPGNPAKHCFLCPEGNPHMMMVTYTLTPYFKKLPLISSVFIYDEDGGMFLIEIYELVKNREDARYQEFLLYCSHLAPDFRWISCLLLAARHVVGFHQKTLPMADVLKFPHRMPSVAFTRQCECRTLPGMLKLTTSSSSSVSLIIQRFPVFVNLLKNPDFPIRYALTHCKNGRFFRF